ncbi:hypothetical protein MPTK1_4g12920 [Marchantia polymorpha subsp. ruderalis]|uniref:Uncharacterized protein n=2 Tax=Marchantia polymorpha TaxID=3197 RepID=A0AAF6B9C2_MARPO|nr:hypothetical protein MARPO_0138s0030 [Marchantia polymorpha]BBN08606.1 hypothetical protein Mp_4g12920 [Marchantia polymorpha subsp. ruderalis]|eukprot:PTQ29594.1 hypothetical protein MARPO_0138s0030 [Marchantia polymorpha]
MRSATWSRGFEGDGLSLQESISVAAHVSAAQRRRTFMLELVGPSESNAARRVDSMLAADQKLSAPRCDLMLRKSQAESSGGGPALNLVF